MTEPCFGIGHNLSLICHLTSEDINHQLIIRGGHIVQELCESRGGRPGLSVLTRLLVSVDVTGIGLSLSLIRQLTSEDIKRHYLPSGGHSPIRAALSVRYALPRPRRTGGPEILQQVV